MKINLTKGVYAFTAITLLAFGSLVAKDTVGKKVDKAVEKTQDKAKDLADDVRDKADKAKDWAQDKKEDGKAAVHKGVNRL